MANLSNINNKFLVTTGGNVLIGTTADVATVRLHVKNTSAAAVLRLTGGSDSWDFDTYYTDNKLFIKSNGAGGTVMTLLGASGNVGIGTDSPGAALDVQGPIGAGVFAKFGINDAANDDPSIQIIGRNTANTTAKTLQIGLDADADYAYFNYNGGSSAGYIYLKPSGNVGIGTASPAATLEVQQSGITVTNTQAFVASFIGDGYGTGQVAVLDSATIAADVGGEIQFGGKYTGNALTEWASIGGYKDNATDGQYGGYFAIKTRAHGASQTEKMRINSEGCIYNVNSYTSTFFGLDAGNIANQTGVHNAGFGHKALEDMTTGAYNTGLGAFALENNTTGYENTAIGYAALYDGSTGGYKNTAVGSIALGKVTTGYQNIGIGAGSGQNLTTGYNNVNVGTNAGYSNVDGIQNTYIGAAAGYTSPGQNYNTFVGRECGYYNTANESTAVGRNAMHANTTGTSNTAMGAQALTANQTGSYNTAIGYQSLFNSTADSVTAFGYHSGLSNTTGGSNTFIGQQCHGLNQTGYGNTSMGMQAAYNGTAGIQNTYIGYAAGYGQTGTGGHYNTCVGFYASKTIGAGNTHNTTMGYYAGGGSGSGVFSGDANTTIGSYCGTILTSGAQNTFVGQSAGSNVTSGSNNTCLGYDADTPSNSSTNTIVLGNSSVSSLQCQVQTISALSDERDKTNIKDSNYGLDLIDSLKPVTFEWNQRDGNRKGKKDLGFIAQDLQKVNDEHLDLINDENPEKLLASYSRLIPVLVKSIQELKAEIELLKNK